MTTYSRLGKIEEKKQVRKLALALGGIVVITVLLLVFGLNILVGFSLFMDKIRGTTPTPTGTAQTSLIFAPVFDPVVEATNTATIKVTARGQAGLHLLLYVNDEQSDKVTVDKDGAATVEAVPLTEGVNKISAKFSDDKGNLSELSQVYTITYKKSTPKLILNTPEDNTTVNGDTASVNVTGITEEDTTITINGRLVVVHGDNSFTYAYPLNDGDNMLSVVATDRAGNQTTINRKVTYHK